MSYLITSNIPTDEIQQKDGINKPFAYFNNLQNTHIIPANSEIAVESCKIVKDGKISVHRENNVFYFYYGEKLSDTKPIEDTLYHPIRAAIYADGQTADAAQVNVDDFASMLDDTVRRSLYHPNLQPSSINTISSKCTVKRDTNNLDFEGFKISITSATSASNASHFNQTWIPATLNQSSKVIPNGSGVTNNLGVSNLHCIATQFPLSLAGGQCEFNLDNITTIGEEFEWMVGLSRCTRNKTASGGNAPVLESPEYFEYNNGGGLGGGGEEFYDYMVTCQKGTTNFELRIYQSIYNHSTEELEMHEFDYRQSRTHDKGNYVNVTGGSASTIESIRFTATGEQMQIEFYDAITAKYEVIVNGKNASSVLNLKPINQNCWLMFPKMRIPAGDNIYIEEFDGVPIDNFVYGGVTSSDPEVKMKDKQSNQDWWATQTNLDRQNYCEDVDSRYMVSLTQYDGATARDYTQKGLTVSNDPDLNSVFILQQSDLYKPTRFASAGRILGFPNRPILDAPSSSSGPTVNFVSDSVPQFGTAGSIFIRLKNFTFTSQNFAKSSQSKILFHLPQFDNSGSEYGALYFQVPERMYLKLNNPNEIYLNDIDVEFVYSDERLCTSLVGKTIVCFHIRQSKDELKK